MRRLSLIPVFSLVLTLSLHAVDSRVSPILDEWGISPSEKNVIIAVFEDAEYKKLDKDELVSALKEMRLKNQSFYDTTKVLLQKSKALDAAKRLNFPGFNDPSTRKVGLYLMEIYPENQLKKLLDEMNARKIPVKDSRALFELAVFMDTGGIPVNDHFTILYLLVKSGQSAQADSEQIKKTLLYHKTYRKSTAEIGEKLKTDLLQGKRLKKILNEIKSE